MVVEYTMRLVYLRYTLMGKEIYYQIRIPSKHLNNVRGVW